MSNFKFWFQIKKKQQKILDILVSKKFDFDKFDIASNPDAKAEMRKLAGNERALPPQLAVGEKFLGVSWIFAV